MKPFTLTIFLLLGASLLIRSVEPSPTNDPPLITSSGERTTPESNEETTTTFLENENSNESQEESTSPSSTEEEEDITVILFQNGGDSDSMSPGKVGNSTTKRISISKRDADPVKETKSSDRRDDKDEDDKDSQGKVEENANPVGNTTGFEDKSNLTSKGHPRNSTTSIILVPFRPLRPRPILIDIIFFRVNRTGNGNSSTTSNQTDLLGSPPLSGLGRPGHSTPINSDEYDGPTTASTGLNSNSELRGVESKKKSDALDGDEGSSPSPSTKSPESTKRRKRAPVFPHFTNNSQSTSNLDEKTGVPSDEERSTTFPGQEVVEVSGSSQGKTTSPPPETNKEEGGNSNQPQFQSKAHNDDNSHQIKNDTIPTTSTENPVFSIFKEIIEYGGNVTKALLGVVDSKNANSGRNRSESFGTNDGNDDADFTPPIRFHKFSTSAPTSSSPINNTTSRTTTISPSDSNQNSTSRCHEPQNGSDFLEQ